MIKPLQQQPEAFAEELVARGRGRAAFVRGEDGRLRASAPWLAPMAEALDAAPDGDGHEGIFLARAPTSGALLGAFLHRLARGQGQGGLRHVPYPTLDAFCRDGLRLAAGMGRKNALAGLWWSGGKGLIARLPDGTARDPRARATLYREYGAFVSSLRGCYVTAEDSGTGPDDMARVFERTRFVTCIPPEAGGSGNPSASTAAGVVCGIEAALEAGGTPSLAGRTVAMQGVGHVGEPMIDLLLERGVSRIVASEIDGDRARAVAARHADAPVEIRTCAPDDTSILFEAVDVLSPNALGGVLGPETLPKVRAGIVCGGANNPLVDEDRDAETLRRAGVVYVPDYVVNRMGIVRCADEQFGSPVPDPEVLRHLDAEHPHGIRQVVLRLLHDARERGVSTTRAARDLADRALAEPHPLFPGRARAIVDTLDAEGWAQSGP